jgi:ferritin-like metal-binding protein YciE
MAAKVQTLEDAFVEGIRDLYDAEKQLVKALPKMAKASHSEELRSAFQEHLEVTKGHVTRLEQVFESMDQKARSKPCKAMKGLVEEGQEIITEGKETEEHIADLELIGAAQKVEHYEMAGYGTMRTWAQQMGNREVGSLLEQTLKEEEEADKKLTQVAKALYKQAMRGGGSSGGDSSRSSSGGGRKKSQASVMEEEDEDVEMETEDV